MATTTYGTSYATSADLVSAWPAASLLVANSVDAAGYYIGRGINAQVASYTGVLTDAGKTITMTNVSANTFTIPANASVAYPTGTRINVLNLGAGACTVTAGAGVTIAGTVAALAINGAASVIKTATNTWSYVPFASGAGNAVISSTTGLAATYPQTYSSGGKNYRVYLWNGSGTAVIGTAGLADILLIGGGGGGCGGNSYGGGGGGGGGYFSITQTAYLESATLTITVGAGGAADVTTAAQGGISRAGNYYAIGGGSGAGRSFPGTTGGSGGGGASTDQPASTSAGLGISGLGNAGGAEQTVVGINNTGTGGGGGATAVGGNPSNNTGGVGGAGTASTILDGATSVTRAGGGGGAGTAAGSAGGAGGGGTGSTNGAAGTAGSVNSGGGGGAGILGTGQQAGGSGICIIRVEE